MVCNYSVYYSDPEKQELWKTKIKNKLIDDWTEILEKYKNPKLAEKTYKEFIEDMKNLLSGCESGAITIEDLGDTEEEYKEKVEYFKKAVNFSLDDFIKDRTDSMKEEIKSLESGCLPEDLILGPLGECYNIDGKIYWPTDDFDYILGQYQTNSNSKRCKTPEEVIEVFRSQIPVMFNEEEIYKLFEKYSDAFVDFH